jgi:hypothetical protein
MAAHLFDRSVGFPCKSLGRAALFQTGGRSKPFFSPIQLRLFFLEWDRYPCGLPTVSLSLVYGASLFFLGQKAFDGGP